MYNTLEVELEKKRTEFYKDLTVLSKFSEKKVDVDSKDLNSFRLASEFRFC